MPIISTKFLLHVIEIHENIQNNMNYLFVIQHVLDMKLFAAYLLMVKVLIMLSKNLV
jgi:uncharacterized membrane protein YqjE